MSEPFAQLPGHWSPSRIDRVASVNARIGWKALTADEYQLDGYVFLSTPNIKGDQVDFEDVNYISSHRYEESPELKLAIGDVLLVKDGNTLGITNLILYLPRSATVNGSIAVIRPFGVYPGFLRYVLASGPSQERISAMKGGMGVPHLFQWDIKRFPIPLPPLDEQLWITNLLDAETARIDALIAKKLRLVELIGGRRQTWLDQLFAQNSRRYRLKHLLKQSPCYGVLVPSFAEDGVPFIRVNDITMLKDRSGALVQINNAQSREYIRTVVRVGDVLLSVVGSIDKVAVVGPEVAGANVARAVARLVPATSVPSELLAQWLTTTQYIDQARLATSSDTAQPTLNMGDLANFEVSFPKPETREAVLQRSRAELRRYRTTELLLLRQVSLLQERRQALITTAVTGELEIPAGVAD